MTTRLIGSILQITAQDGTGSRISGLATTTLIHITKHKEVFR